MRMDFISLLLTFVVFVCLTSNIMMYQRKISFPYEQRITLSKTLNFARKKPKDEFVMLSDNKSYQKNYSMVPYSQLNDSIKLLNRMTRDKITI